MVNLLNKFINGDERIIDRVPPLIYQSWKRCRQISLNHERIVQRDILLKNELVCVLDRNEALLAAARPVFQHMFAVLRGKNYLLVLSDQEGYIIETFGDPTIVQKAKKQISLTIGANWQESQKGTNGVGTVLIEQKPISIPGWTHYAQPVSFLDCWAAPIRRADGGLAGVLNISGEVGLKHERMIEITTTGAAMIEHTLIMSELREKFNHCLADFNNFSKMISGNVVDINTNLMKIHASTWKFNADANCRDLIGKNIDDVLPGRQECIVIDSINNKPAGANEWYGCSRKIRDVFNIAMRAAKVDSTVLIQGESGTGKEIVARSIHKNSSRSEKPFITLNCAAIPDSLVESELFGYADGAFTGAKKGGQAGKFEMANGGTIFLDEIGDMPINMQATLLRVLQQKEVYRIGDGTRREINVRIIAATNQDLKQLINQGKFRLDLYYRLDVIHIAVPPLRERIEDLLDLVPHFVAKFCAKHGLPTLEVNPELYQYLSSYPWPGNVRQLENCVESMIALSNGASILTVKDLPPEYAGDVQDKGTNENGVLSSQTTTMERATIIRILREADGNIAEAARKLGIGRTTLYRKLVKLSIPY